MHNKNGRVAQVGDRVIRFTNGVPDLVGVLIEANPESDTCNGQIVPLPAISHYATLGDCLHVEDIASPSSEEAAKYD